MLVMPLRWGPIRGDFAEEANVLGDVQRLAMNHFEAGWPQRIDELSFLRDPLGRSSRSSFRLT